MVQCVLRVFTIIEPIECIETLGGGQDGHLRKSALKNCTNRHVLTIEYISYMPCTLIYNRHIDTCTVALTMGEILHGRQRALIAGTRVYTFSTRPGRCIYASNASYSRVEYLKTYTCQFRMCLHVFPPWGKPNTLQDTPKSGQITTFWGILKGAFIPFTKAAKYTFNRCIVMCMYTFCNPLMYTWLDTAWMHLCVPGFSLWPIGRCILTTFS